MAGILGNLGIFMAFFPGQAENAWHLFLTLGVVIPGWQLQVLSLDLVNKYLELIIVRTTPIRDNVYYDIFTRKSLLNEPNV